MGPSVLGPGGNISCELGNLSDFACQGRPGLALGDGRLYWGLLYLSIPGVLILLLWLLLIIITIIANIVMFIFLGMHIMMVWWPVWWPQKPSFDHGTYDHQLQSVSIFSMIIHYPTSVRDFPGFFFGSPLFALHFLPNILVCPRWYRLRS